VRPPADSFRLRPASRPLPVWVGLAASGRKASSFCCARFSAKPGLGPRRRPIFARLVSIRMPRLRLVSWSAVSAARPCCGLLRPPQRVRAVLSAAGCVVGLGVSFLKRSLRARPAPAAFRSSVAAVTGLAFLRSRNRVSALPRPAPLVRAGHAKARSNQVGDWEAGTESLKGRASPTVAGSIGLALARPA